MYAGTHACACAHACLRIVLRTAQSLLLSDNALVRLHAGIDRHTNLYDLDITNNDLGSLPASMLNGGSGAGLTQLVSLNLLGNPIAVVEAGDPWHLSANKRYFSGDKKNKAKMAAAGR